MELPRDIVNLIAVYLDSKIQTLLNKWIRERYFRKNNIIVDFLINKGGLENVYQNLKKYNITLINFNGIDTKIYDVETRYRITILKDSRVMRLDEILLSFPNLSGIYGCYIWASADNFRDLSKIDNDAIIITTSREGLDLYKKFLPKNLVSVHSYNEHEDYTEIGEKIIFFHGIYPLRVYKGHYPNLKLVQIGARDGIAEIDAPLIEMVIMNVDWATKWEKYKELYPNLKKMIVYENYGRTCTYEYYKILSSLPVSFMVYQDTDYLIEYEKKYRAENPDKEHVAKEVFLRCMNVDYSPLIKSGLFRHKTMF